MSQPVIWRGTETERWALLEAVDNNCGCRGEPGAAERDVCAAHLLLRDQRVLDHMLFGRRLAAQLGLEEFEPTAAA